MSIFQDKKILIHVSLEIVVIGTMLYFFYTKSKQMEERLKLLEEQMIKTNQLLHEDINMIKKNIKKLEQKSPRFEPIFNFNKSKKSQNFSQNLSHPLSPKIVEISDTEDSVSTFSIDFPSDNVKEKEKEKEEEKEEVKKDDKLLLDKELESELNELDLI
jgi:hypothetical protein